MKTTVIMPPPPLWAWEGKPLKGMSLDYIVFDELTKTVVIDSVTSLQQQIMTDFGAMQMGISLKPSDAVSGGGLLDDADVTLKACRAAMWDYNGTVKVPVVALQATIEQILEDGSAQDIIQYYSAGDSKNFVPSDDGRKFVPVSDATGLNSNCNAMLFLVSLINGGFPEDKVGDDLSVFDGTKCHVKRMLQPVRPGFVPANTGGKGDGKILLVTPGSISQLPWDAPAPAKSGKKATPAVAPKVNGGVSPAASASAPASDIGSNQELAADAVGFMLQVLANKGGSLTKAQIGQEIFKAAAAHPQRAKLVQLAFSDEFLKAGPWQFDGTTATMG